MRDFWILISQLLFTAMMQLALSTYLEAIEAKWLIKIINISCIAICYILLFRYVYNLYNTEISAFINFF